LGWRLELSSSQSRIEFTKAAGGVGPTIVALSLPVTIAYFVALWRSWPLTGGGLITAGFLCGIFPFFFGFFPVYYLRLVFAAPVAFLQIALLIGAITLFAKFGSR